MSCRDLVNGEGETEKKESAQGEESAETLLQSPKEARVERRGAAQHCQPLGALRLWAVVRSRCHPRPFTLSLGVIVTRFFI